MAREPGVLLPRPSPGDLPLYLHVPFCAAKCHYCDFYSFAAVRADAGGFVETLLREAELRAGARPPTVFVGGGTPSWLDDDDLRALLDGLHERTEFRRSALEVTVECNPESLGYDKASLLGELGATRLSIGVQSLRADQLERFGRVHGPDDSARAFEAARRAGFDDVNVDLIYGAPGQGLEEWESDLQAVLDWGPTHVSAYHLTFEPGTAFERWRQEGRLERLPEERELAFFETTHDILEQRGYPAYEVSNFALDGRQCRHNLNYWDNGPYVGLGPSAVSCAGGRRSGNARSLDTWRAAVRTDAAPEWTEALSPRGRLGETWWLGLRTRRGVDPGRARASAGFPGPDDPCVEVARSLVASGLLTEDPAGRFALTRRALPLADAVAAHFLVADPEAVSS